MRSLASEMVKRSKAAILNVLRVASVAIVFSGCGDSVDPGPGGGDEVASIEVSPTVDTLLALGQTTQFTAVARKADGTVVSDARFTWNSSAPSVATVNATGLATAAANGVAVIAASLGVAVATASLTISQLAATVSLAIDRDTLSAIEDTVSVTASAADSLGNDIAFPALDWSSSDTLVATIDSRGLVTARGDGDATLTASAGSASQGIALTVFQQAIALAVTVQPDGARSGDTLTTQPIVEVHDANGHPVARDSSTLVSVSLLPDTASLGGADSATVAGGVARFTGLSITDTVGSYVMQFAAAGLSPVPSDTVALAAGRSSVNRSVVTMTTDTVAAGGQATATVRLKDAQGNDLSGGGQTITFFAGGGSSAGTFSSVTDAGDGTYSASFTGSTAGTALLVGATIDGDTVTTAGPSVTVIAAQASVLTFSSQPMTVTAGETFSPAPLVTAMDAFGNVAGDFSDTVMVRLVGAGSGTLLGQNTEGAVGGVSSFPSLTVDIVGDGYALVATATGLSPDTSLTFSVRPGAATSLRFDNVPDPAEPLSSLTPGPQVSATDSFGNVDTTFTSGVTLSLAANSNGGTLSGALTVSAAMGVAVFSNLTIDSIGFPYSLTAFSPSVASDTSVGFAVVPVGTSVYWTGVSGTDWSTAANWNTGTTPIGSDNVFIPSGLPVQPVVGSSAATTDLFVMDGATVTVSGGVNLTVAGDLKAGNTIGGSGTVVMTGDSTTVSGVLPALSVQGITSARGAASVNGDLSVSGELNLNSFRVDVTGSLNKNGNIIMATSADSLLVAGDANLNDGAGIFSAGILAVGGDVSGSVFRVGAYTPTGTHVLLLNGSLPQTVSGPFVYNDIVFASADSVVMTDVTISGAATVNSGRVTGTGSVTLAGQIVDSAGGRWQVDTRAVAPSLTLPDSLNLGQLIISDTVKLAKGFKLVGNLVVELDSGNLDLNGQRIDVIGDLNKSGYIVMQNASDSLFVLGDANLTDGGGAYTNGVLAVTGAVNGSVFRTGAYAPAGAHRLLLNGSAPQTLTGPFTYNDVEFANADSVVLGASVPIAGSAIVTAGRVTGSAAVTLGGPLLDAAGGRWQVDTRVVAPFATLPDSMNMGQLLVGDTVTLVKGFKIVGDLVVELDSGSLNLNGNRVDVIGALNKNGILNMINPGDSLFVDGDANLTDGGGAFTDGVLATTGTLNGSVFRVSAYVPTAGHRLLLNGSGFQALAGPFTYNNVVFSNPDSVDITGRNIAGTAIVSAGRVVGSGAMTLSGNLVDSLGGRWNVDTRVAGPAVSLPDSMVTARLIFGDTTALSRGFKIVGDVEIEGFGAGDLDLNGQVVTVSGNLSLGGKLTVTTGVTLTISQTLTLQSNSLLVNNGTIVRGACSRGLNATVIGVDPCP